MLLFKRFPGFFYVWDPPLSISRFFAREGAAVHGERGTEICTRPGVSLVFLSDFSSLSVVGGFTVLAITICLTIRIATVKLPAGTPDKWFSTAQAEQNRSMRRQAVIVVINRGSIVCDHPGKRIPGYIKHGLDIRTVHDALCQAVQFQSHPEIREEPEQRDNVVIVICHHFVDILVIIFDMPSNVAGSIIPA